MKEATDYANKIAKEENDRRLAGMKESGKTTVYEPTEEESWPSRRPGAGAQQDGRRVGKEMLQDHLQGDRLRPDQALTGSTSHRIIASMTRRRSSHA